MQELYCTNCSIWILKLAKALESVSQACKHLAIEKNNELLYNQEITDNKEKSDEILF